MFQSRLQLVAEWLVLLVPPLMYLGRGPTDVAISLVALLFLARCCAAQDWQWLKAGWVRAGLLLWLFLMLHSLFQQDPLHSLSRAAPWGRYLLFAAALAFWIALDMRFSKKLFISVVAVSALMALDAWLQYLSGISLTGNQKWASRLTGPYDMPRLGYSIAWIAVPVLACCLHGGKHWMETLLKLAFAAFIIAAIVLTGDRTPTLLAFVAVVAIFVISSLLRRKMLYAAVAGVVLASLLLTLQPDLYKRHIGDTQKHLGDFWHEPYGELVLDSWDLIKQHPLFGIGVKEYRHVSQSMRQPQPHPHNNYLELQVESGVFGLALLLALYGIWMHDMWRSYPLWQYNILAVGLAAAVLIRLFPFAPSPSFYTNWNAIPLWLMLGWWYGQKNALCRDAAQKAQGATPESSGEKP